MKILGRLQDAKTVLEQLLAYVIADQNILSKFEQKQLAKQLNEAASQPITEIHSRPEAIIYADRFIAAARCVPQLKEHLPPIGSEMFNLRQVFDPSYSQEATPDKLKIWQSNAQELAMITQKIMTQLSKLNENSEINGNGK